MFTKDRQAERVHEMVECHLSDLLSYHFRECGILNITSFLFIPSGRDEAMGASVQASNRERWCRDFSLMCRQGTKEHMSLGISNKVVFPRKSLAFWKHIWENGNMGPLQGAGFPYPPHPKWMGKQDFVHWQ